MKRLINRILGKILPSTRYEVWKSNSENSYTLIRNIDDEYYSFVMNGNPYYWNPPFWVKTKVLYTNRFIPYYDLPKQYSKIMVFYARR